MKPKLHQSVYVGGCVGSISRVTSEQVEVRGTYTYYMGEGKSGRSEPWVFQYDIKDLTELQWCPVRNEWDLAAIKPLQESGI